MATGIIVGWILLRVLQAGVARLEDANDKMQERMDSIDRAVAQVREDRMACEIRSARHFATHAEVLQVLSDNAVQWGGVRDQISALHEKINPLATDIGLIKGRMEQR